jgi:hypothetical protein
MQCRGGLILSWMLWNETLFFNYSLMLSFLYYSRLLYLSGWVGFLKGYLSVFLLFNLSLPDWQLSGFIQLWYFSNLLF